MELDARAFLAGLFEGEAGTQHDVDRLGALEIVTTIEPPGPAPDRTAPGGAARRPAASARDRPQGVASGGPLGDRRGPGAELQWLRTAGGHPRTTRQGGGIVFRLLERQVMAGTRTVGLAEENPDCGVSVGIASLQPRRPAGGCSGRGTAHLRRRGQDGDESGGFRQSGYAAARTRIVAAMLSEIVANRES